jgi:hypothetical protein
MNNIVKNIKFRIFKTIFINKKRREKNKIINSYVN